MRAQELTDKIRFDQPLRNLRQMLLEHSSADREQVLQLADLLERVFNLSPSKRIDVDAALRHPFVSERAAAGAAPAEKP